MPTAAGHPTRLQHDALTSQRRFGWLHSLFTQRPLAKLLSLGLGILLVLMIDTELTGEIYKESVQLVAPGEGRGRTDLEVQVPQDFILLLDPNQGSTVLRIRGYQKLQDQIPVPLKAYVPEHRFAKVGNEPVSILLQGEDLRLPRTLDRADARFDPPVTIRVVRRGTVERELKAIDGRTTGRQGVLTVAFQPRIAKLTGPVNQLGSADEPLEILVTSLGERTLTADMLGLGPLVGLVGPPITFVATQPPPTTEALTLENVSVPLNGVFTSTTRFEYRFLAPDDKGALGQPVVVEGTPAAIAALRAKETMDEFKRKVYALAYVEDELRKNLDAVNNQARSATTGEDRWIDLEHVRVEIPEHLLASYNVKVVPLKSVSVQVRLKPPENSGPQK